MNDKLGKDAEHQIRKWLDRPESGYSFDRIPDQMNGFYGSCNICDFLCFKAPCMYYIESKATWKERFDFNMISNYQFEGLLKKSMIDGVYGLVVVLFATQKRAFILNIQDIARMKEDPTSPKSINIDKIDKWTIPYVEIRTIPNSRKQLLDYEGEIEEYTVQLVHK